MICKKKIILAICYIISITVSCTDRYPKKTEDISSLNTQSENIEQTVPQTNKNTILVSSEKELVKAFEDAKPDNHIIINPGIYYGSFKISKSGLKNKEIKISGEGATIKGSSISSGYGLFIKGSHLIIEGLKVENFKKGIVLESASNNVLQMIKIDKIGEEGLHLRKQSSKNIIKKIEISNTGLKNPGFGEGIYIGSATNHWCEFTNCQEDKCDNNQILENNIYSTTAEPIDIKEGTSHTIVAGNIFDGNKVTGENSADSHIDLKGNFSLIETNYFKNSSKNKLLIDAIQVHKKYAGWGENNLISKNYLDDNLKGYGVNVHSKSINSNNVVSCNNNFMQALMGISNVPCKN